MTRRAMRCAALIWAVAVSWTAFGQITVYESSFEVDDDGWVGTHDWQRGIPTALPLTGCDGSPVGVPPTAHDGVYVWATGVGECYTNCNCNMMLSRTVDLRGTNAPTLRFHSWKHVFGEFDYTAVHVVPTGTGLHLGGGFSCPSSLLTALLIECDADISPGWVEHVIDLSEFEGQVVDLYFVLHASPVINNPGWYIDNVRITSEIVPTPGDLQVTIRDEPDPVGLVGMPITYTVTVVNADPDPIENVVVTTNLDATTPFLSATAGSASNGVHTVFYPAVAGLSAETFEIAVSTTTLGEALASTSVTGGAVDPNPSNNTAAALTTVTNLADLEVAIMDAPDPVHAPGEQIVYDVVVTNNGPADAHNVALSFDLPAQAGFVSTSAGTHDGASSGGRVSAVFPVIPSGLNQAVTVRVAPGVNGQYTASASVQAEETDALQANNAAQAITIVDVSADIGVTLAAAVNPMMQTGSENTLTLTVTNHGPTPATDVSWNLVLPSAFTFVSTTDGVHDGSAVGGWITSAIPSLPVGGARQINVEVVANTLTEAALTSAFAFAAGPQDGDLANNQVELATEIRAAVLPSVQVIFSDDGFPGLPTSVAPHVPDRLIQTIDRPVVSPGGTKWAISLNLNGDVGSDDIIVVWDGTQFFTPVQEGVTVTPQADRVGIIDQDLAINDAGVVAFATNTDGPTDRDEIAAKVSPDGTLVVIAREGQPVPGTAVTYRGDAIDSVQIDNDGNVYFSSSTSDLPDRDEYIVRSADGVTAEVLVREGVTIPAGQYGGATHAWSNFALNALRVTGDGQHMLLQGITQGPSQFDVILTYDGTVVVQEGVVAHPSFFTPADSSTPLSSITLAANGDWYAIGDNEDGEWWILRNGEPIARSDEEAFPGAGVYWTEFLSVAADARGNYVVSGFVTAPLPEDSLLVLNGQRLIAREGDPIDVDGNGLFDDGAVLGSFGIEDAIITADGRLIVTVTTRAPGGVATTGELLLSFDLELPSTCPCETDGNLEHVNVFDLLAYLDTWFAGAALADIDGVPGVDVFDLLAFLDCWFEASAGGGC